MTRTDGRRFTYNEVMYMDCSIVTFITDGDPYLTARSMGEYISIRSYEIPQGDGREPAEDGGGEGPGDAAEELYETLSERVMARRGDEEHVGGGNRHRAFLERNFPSLFGKRKVPALAEEEEHVSLHRGAPRAEWGDAAGEVPPLPLVAADSDEVPEQVCGKFVHAGDSTRKETA